MYVSLFQSHHNTDSINFSYCKTVAAWNDLTNEAVTANTIDRNKAKIKKKKKKKKKKNYINRNIG